MTWDGAARGPAAGDLQISEQNFKLKDLLYQVKFSSYNLKLPVWIFFGLLTTVPFNSVRQSRVTGPSKSPKCHVGHGNFYKVPKSFCDLALNYRIFLPPAAQNCGKFPNVTVSLGGCRNQNFVRRVTHHMGCRSELNGTVDCV